MAKFARRKHQCPVFGRICSVPPIIEICGLPAGNSGYRVCLSEVGLFKHYSKPDSKHSTTLTFHGGW